MFQPILSMLRVNTAAAHARLEARVRIEEQLGDPESYASLLERFLGFYEPLERRLAALHCWSASGIDFGARIKSPWLKNDLSTLGRSEAQIEALPRCDELPKLGAMAQGYGCAYVLEGATLGGRQINGMIGDRLPLNARRFFSSYGDQVGLRWKEFLAALEAFAGQAGSAREEIVATALQTFSCMELWLAEGGI